MHHNGFLYSGGDDNVVRVWDIARAKQLEVLEAHTNGVTSIAMCNQMIITSSYDRFIITWDLPNLEQKCSEMLEMWLNDIDSRKLQIYYKVLEEKKVANKKLNSAEKRRNRR